MSAKPTMVAVVPTFSPPPNLGALVATLASSGHPVLVSDDASPCTSDSLLRRVEEDSRVSVARHRTNRGIARGLNEGIALAQQHDAQWLLTMDQDSMVDDGYAAAVAKAAVARQSSGERLGALGAEVIEDASGPMTYPLRMVDGFQVTEEIIQTGTVWSIPALVEIGGFDESMGMDAVDAAACLALRKAGFAIGVVNDLRVDHSIGQSRTMNLGGRRVMVTGHSPERRTSMLRSRLRLLPGEFTESPRHALRTIRRVAVNQTVGLVIEDQRWEKAKGTARGLLPSRTR